MNKFLRSLRSSKFNEKVEAYETEQKEGKKDRNSKSISIYGNSS